MIGIILVSHGMLAEGILDSGRMILEGYAWNLTRGLV